MAKKSFSAGVTKTGVLDNAGGAKLKKYRQRHNIIPIYCKGKNTNPTQKMKNTRRMELNPLWKAFW